MGLCSLTCSCLPSYFGSFFGDTSPRRLFQWKSWVPAACFCHAVMEGAVGPCHALVNPTLARSPCFLGRNYCKHPFPSSQSTFHSFYPFFPYSDSLIYWLCPRALPKQHPGDTDRQQPAETLVWQPCTSCVTCFSIPPSKSKQTAHLPLSGCHLSPPKMHGAALTLFPGLWPLKGPVGDVLLRMGTTANQRAYPFHHVDQITKVCRASLSDLCPADGVPAAQVLSPIVAAGIGASCPMLKLQHSGRCANGEGGLKPPSPTQGNGFCASQRPWNICLSKANGASKFIPTSVLIIIHQILLTFIILQQLLL